MCQIQVFNSSVYLDKVVMKGTDSSVFQFCSTEQV